MALDDGTLLNVRILETELGGTLDDSSEVWDIIPMMEFLIENTTDPNRISFLVTGVYKFRVGVRRSGSTDTITSVDLSYRKDGVNV